MRTKRSLRKTQGQQDLEKWTADLHEGVETQVVEVHSHNRFDVDARKIRASLGLSRQEFASRYGLSLRTIENWETGVRVPEGPAKSLLIAIAYAHEAVAEAFREYRNGNIPGAAMKSRTKFRRRAAGVTELDATERLRGVARHLNAIEELLPLQVPLDHLLQTLGTIVTLPVTESDRAKLEQALREVNAPVAGGQAAMESR